MDSCYGCDDDAKNVNALYTKAIKTGISSEKKNRVYKAFLWFVGMGKTVQFCRTVCVFLIAFVYIALINLWQKPLALRV